MTTNNGPRETGDGVPEQERCGRTFRPDREMRVRGARSGPIPALPAEHGRLLAVLLATFLLRLPSLWEPRWAPDEGVLSAVGQGMLHGQRLYADIWDNQAPLVYAWMAAVLAMTQGWHPGMQLVLAAQVLAATAFVYLIAIRIGARPALSAMLFGLVAALPIVEGNLQNSELIGLPLFLGGLWLGLRGGLFAALAAGAALAAAAACQPVYALQALSLAFYLLFAGRPLRLAAIAIAGLAATLALWGVLAATGSWTAYMATSASDRDYLVWANGGPAVAPAALFLRL